MILDGISYDPFDFDHILLMLGLFLLYVWFLDLVFDIAFQVMFFKDEHDSILSCSEVLCSINSFIKIGVVCHL